MQSAAETSLADRFRGCLLGGACGDALGGAVEFLSTAAITRRFGAGGIREMAEAYGRVGAITDDTQMTLWTAEGLLRAQNRWRGRGICHPPTVVAMAYARWLLTQGEQPGFTHSFPDWQPDGWLFDVKGLHSRRAPGNTCLAGLRRASIGTIAEPPNQSKGCGGVMRVAPVGLFAEEPFRLGAEIAAITHGHPSGYLSAGFHAALIGRIVRGERLTRAIGATKTELFGWAGHEETLAAVEAAERLAESQPRPTPETVELLGGGWTGEEALAIALYCALTAESFEQAIVAAVNHSGDSDSTGSICGNILGALWGVAVVPPRWLATLELREVIARLARDLLPPNEGGPPELLWNDYPGN